ncbi:hypothetical protein [Phreatobacter oligotrophus]|uniref:hypothetical protein n=1 Tax=Phreatobacter oligotrophus TaxID=1122261 RepID=UPI001FE75C56|nr:hypothetical protein [Phreatobacter oligotrophus]
MAALAVAALALGGVHWLVRDQDRRVHVCITCELGALSGARLDPVEQATGLRC